MAEERNPFRNKRKFDKKKFVRWVNRQQPHIKVKLVAEKKDGSKCEIPLTKYEIYNLCELSFICDDTCQTLELNKIDLASIFKKIQHLEFDVINEGTSYDMKGKRIKEEDKQYLIKKPKWKKGGGSG